MNSGLFSSVCSGLRESLPGVATSSAAAHHLILPLLLLLLDVQAAPAKGAAVVSSSQVSKPLKQEEEKEEEEEGATAPTKRAASQLATSPLPASPAQVSLPSQYYREKKCGGWVGDILECEFTTCPVRICDPFIRLL